jgi:hypothetical protein
MAKIDIKTLGLAGVNVDKDPLELDPDELTKAQNAIHEPLGSNAGIKNRPGLIDFTGTAGPGSILGGTGVLEPAGGDVGGLELLYLGRGGAV